MRRRFPHKLCKGSLAIPPTLERHRTDTCPPALLVPVSAPVFLLARSVPPPPGLWVSLSHSALGRRSPPALRCIIPQVPAQSQQRGRKEIERLPLSQICVLICAWRCSRSCGKLLERPSGYPLQNQLNVLACPVAAVVVAYPDTGISDGELPNNIVLFHTCGHINTSFPSVFAT